MRNKKTKIKFADIAGMLNGDEMREIVGGAGQLTIYNNSNSSMQDSSILPVVNEGGMLDNPFASHFVGLGHGFGWTQFGYQTNSSFSNSAGSINSWQVTTDGLATSSPETIKQFMELLSSSGLANTSANTSNSQNPTDCVFQTLGFISAMYGDQSRDSKFYENAYNKLYGNNANTTPASNGVPTENVLDFIGKFFITNNLNETVPNNIANWLNPNINRNGDNQLMGVYRTGTGGLHSVTVQGIAGNYNNIYDPQNNNSRDIPSIKMEQYYGVSGECIE